MTDRTPLRRRILHTIHALLLACVLAGVSGAVARAQTPPPSLPQPAPDAATCAEVNVFYGAVPPGGEQARVLVFVHGLSGLAQDWWTDQTVAGLNDMYDMAYNAGYRTAFVNANVLDPMGACDPVRRPAVDMLRNGQLLAAQIKAIVNHYNVAQVDIIAHSKGGIDAQSATIWYGAWHYVRNIITVGTPHQGSLLADLLWSPEGKLFGELLGQRDAGMFSLRTPMMKLFRFITDPSRLGENVEYFSGAGNFWDTPGSIYRIFGTWLQAQPDGGDNDGLIVVSATHLDYAEQLYLEPWNHVEITLGRNTFPHVLRVLLADVTPAGGVVVDGPNTGTVERDYNFVAVLPPRTTLPVTYTWQATGHAPVVQSGGTSDVMHFAWGDSGPKEVVVTTTNVAGSSTATHTVEINEVTGPDALSIVGPVIGTTGQAYPFTALLAPATTLPVTYTWQATGQPTLTRSTENTQDVVSYNWQTAGVKTVRVVAENQAGVAVTTYQIHVSPAPIAPTYTRFLPMMRQPGEPISWAQSSAAAAPGSSTIVRGGPLNGATTARFPLEPEAGRVEVSLFTTDPAATATVVGPDGSRSALAAVPNTGTDLFAGSAILAGTVDSPAPGEWQVEMRSTQPTAYLLLVTLESTLNVQLSGADSALSLPEQLLELQVSGSSEAGQAEVASVTLAVGGDDASGEATAQAVSTGPLLRYITPAQFGLYSLSLQASGTTADGYAFERAFMQPLAVIPPYIDLENYEVLLEILGEFLP